MALATGASIGSMLADWSRLRRLGIVVTLASVTVAIPLHWSGGSFQSTAAWADDDEDEEEDDGGDEEEDEDGGDEDDEEQPPVTAGGLFTKETYPQAELLRPLTITKGMIELRAGIDMDMSAETAFETFGLGFRGRYGLEDNVELQGEFRTQLNNFSDVEQGVDSDLVFKAAIEAGIVYDLVDFRLGLSIPYATSDVGGTSSSTTLVDFELGFPFRYAPKPQVGIVALDTFMTINTKGKPDLTPSVGIVVQPVEMLAIKLNGKVVIADFNTDAGNFAIPVSLDIQFSPNNKIDIGGEFTFPNLKPADPDEDGPLEAPAFYDSRFLLLYGQLRI